MYDHNRPILDFDRNQGVFTKADGRNPKSIVPSTSGLGAAAVKNL